MFMANDIDGTRITASTARKGTEYFCPICRVRVILKAGSIKTVHFSHRRIADCLHSLYKKESLLHLEAKCDLYQALSSRHRVEMEYHLPEIEQIPDLLIGRRALEIQYSAISPALITERSSGYHSLGMDVIWLLEERAIKKAEGCIIPTHFQLSTLHNTALFTYSNHHRRLMKWTLRHHRGDNRWTFHTSEISPHDLLDFHPREPVQPIVLEQGDIRRMVQRERRQKNRLNPTLTFLYQLSLDTGNLPPHLCTSVEPERWILNPPLEWKLYIMYGLEKGTFDWQQFSGFIHMREIQAAPPKEEVLRALLAA
ncbi:competence protein CoiA [Salinicoccus luteus]|uniref:competence protein CoiA n=1 Tax=Salinicoccus luteus TaxID=367840 RepID=UPI0004E1AD06|nr:competence protein CoiA family protein [Salinicoccus luteus]